MDWGVPLVFRASLNNREIFWPGVSTSVVSSGVIVLGCLVAAIFLPDRPWSAQRLSVLAAVAGILVFILHLLVGKREVAMMFASGPSFPVGGIAKAITAVLLYQVLNTIPRFIDRGVATDFPQGAVAALEYSFNILTVPGILLATSFITVYYPSFVKAVENGVTQRPYVVKFLGTLGISTLVGLAFFMMSLPSGGVGVWSRCL